jgi:hypothetical protein
MGWVPLIAGLCAMVVEQHSPPMIAIGYIDRQGDCSYRLMLHDTGEEKTPPLEVKPESSQLFQYSAQIKPNAAFLFLNDLMFELPRGEQL